MFEKLTISNIRPRYIPSDITLKIPNTTSLLPPDQHFLIYIPWNNKYLRNIPKKYQSIYKFVLPYLRVRTTDVHVAICFSFFNYFIEHFKDEGISERIIALSLILHDVGWSMLTDSQIAKSLGVKGLKLTRSASDPKELHAIKGQKLAKKLLSQFKFKPPLSEYETDLILMSVLYHDKPEKVAQRGNNIPLEIQLLVDLDHLWSFSHENFWQDTIRKDVDPNIYQKNLQQDLDTYFVTDYGKHIAQEQLNKRQLEIGQLNNQLEILK